MKKISLILATMLLVILAVSLTACTGVDALTFTLNDDGESYSITHAKASISGEITIPQEHNGKPVTSIGDGAFEKCERLTSIFIPAGVTTIGERAFAYCTSLTSVDYTGSVTTIGGWAFLRCSSLTSVKLGKSVTTIGKFAFCDCTSLTSITIPDSVTTIDDSAFCDCTSLTDVYFTGTEEQWNNIAIGSDNDALTNATIHFNYTGEEN